LRGSEESSLCKEDVEVEVWVEGWMDVVEEAKIFYRGRIF
jgi:hypothetical protein